MKRAFIIGLAAVILVVAAYLGASHRQSHDGEMMMEKSVPPPQSVEEAAPERGSTPSSSVSGTEGAGKGDDDVMVEIPPEQRQMVGIKTVEAAVRPVRKTLRTTGRVEFDESKLSTVNIKVEGWVEKLYADYTGKFVRKGTPLAEIYSPELMSVQLEYLNLLKWRPNLGLRTQRNIEFSLGDRFNNVGRLIIYDLDPLVEVAKQRMALWEISEEQIKEIETTKEPMKTLTIKSPASGYVFQKPVFKGTRVAPGDKLFDIVDLSTVWVLADIYEYEMPFVKAGQKARITLSHYPGKEFLSKVDFVYPSLSGQTRTAKARFVIPNPKGLLKPQMFANVEMEIDLGERLAIPETAVLDTGARQVVYVDRGNGYFAPRQVRLGMRSGGVAEVLGGVKAGEKVASSAVFLIDSEAKLKGISQ